MVMIEGMAMGLPVVSSDFKCGPKDIIENGENGIVVRGDNEVDFAESLASVMLDENKRKRMGKNARKIVARYSEARIMDMWMSLFNNLKG